jgi:xanthine dehydrogenase iron-sulfur cluster and FAD-binding subunit A
MWQKYVNAGSIDDVLQIINEKPAQARIIAGGTDLILELEKGLRKGIDILVDVSRIPDLDKIVLDEDGVIHLGPLVTHNHCVASKLLRESALPLVQAAWDVGSPQIRNRGTIAGNLVTGSPANDTITPLMALGAKVTMRSKKRGDRVVDLGTFYEGVRKTVVQPDEMVVDISFPALKKNQRGIYIKHALRRAQAISVVNTAVVLEINEGVVQTASITLGSVAPTIIHASQAEAYLIGRRLTGETITQAGELAEQAAKPISDVRGSAAYRRRMVNVIVRRSLTALDENRESDTLPQSPPLLWGLRNGNGNGQGKLTDTLGVTQHDVGTPILTRINGQAYELRPAYGKTLLRLLREDAGLTGSKEGCAEGECGACTVFLDGAAVMSCMVPAHRAHGAEIVTIEGLAQNGELHPVQQTFIEEGAVQCGYCTPGFLMSAAKLLEEVAKPTNEQIRFAITGNLCRCTGYYKIIRAIEEAALVEVNDG